ncbi:hypothetical protein, partial [Streptomyces brasiliscabiei]|uniref:hypothetical protein n=1 Tax=Streptomyces brasiliscabiei TaxID=2736302 RepID=UPI003014B491
MSAATSPDWVLTACSGERAASADRGTDADVETFFSRLVPGEPSKKARRAAAVDFPRGAAHDAMLDVISALV